MLVAACIMFQDDRQDCMFDWKKIVVFLAKNIHHQPINDKIRNHSSGMKKPVNWSSFALSKPQWLQIEHWVKPVTRGTMIELNRQSTNIDTMKHTIIIILDFQYGCAFFGGPILLGYLSAISITQRHNFFLIFMPHRLCIEISMKCIYFPVWPLHFVC